MKFISSLRYTLVFRCVWYSINGHHKGHLPVKANVSQLTLSLSTLQLDLTEPAFASKSAGEYSMYPTMARKLSEKDSPCTCRFKRFCTHFQPKQCCSVIPVACNRGSGSRCLLCYSFHRFMVSFSVSCIVI